MVGGVILALSVVGFVVVAVLTFSSITETDAVVDATSTAVDVEVEPGQERPFFVPEDQPPAFCELRDGGGDPLFLDPPPGTVTVDADGLTWRGSARSPAARPRSPSSATAPPASWSASAHPSASTWSAGCCSRCGYRSASAWSALRSCS